MIRTLSAAALVAIGATAVWAQNLDVIKERRVLMRQITDASGALSKMSKGEAAYDQAKVLEALKVIENGATKFKTLFPDDSKTGGESDAAVSIWSARAQFDGASDKFAAAAKAAAVSIKDEASLKAEYPSVASGCGGCHKSTGDGFAPRVGELVKKPRP
jgi:cytochrome c556